MVEGRKKKRSCLRYGFHRRFIVAYVEGLFRGLNRGCIGICCDFDLGEVPKDSGMLELGSIYKKVYRG